MQLELTGRVAVVTGASKGIGLAVSRTLLQEGARVLATSRRLTPELDALDVVHVAADLTDPAAPEAIVARALDAFGRIDVLVNNAGGILGRHSLVDMPETFFHAVMDVNVLTMFLCSRAVAPGMIARRQGAIVNLTSLAAHNGGGPGASVYAAAKAAVLTLTKAFARELAPHGVRVNAVSPGLIGGTPFHRDFTSPEGFAAAVKTIPLGRAGEPEDVANVIAFLAGGGSSFVIGETIEINGGMYSR